MLTDILFVLARENESASYRQGMHEVAALLLWVMDGDKVVVPTPPPTGSQPYVPSPEGPLSASVGSCRRVGWWAQTCARLFVCDVCLCVCV
jgi:hypothetical protein